MPRTYRTRCSWPHDSFAAETDKDDLPDCGCRVTDSGSDGGEVKRKVKPKSLLCAVKGVYASLWNKRAIEERSFARIDHATVAMGLAIVPAYDMDSEVAANAVVVTRVLNTSDVYGYSLSVQEGNNLVTNPIRARTPRSPLPVSFPRLSQSA
jgi:phosphoenolpyruvate synthase/pyruvate phosphate dikinase